MKPLSSPDVVNALLPSLGYFGGSMLDCLEINVDFELLSLKLEIQDETPAYLNLRGIEFLGDEGSLDLRKFICHVTQSSVQKNNEGRKNEALLERKGIHSRREIRPWWEVRLKQSVPIRKIRIWNRPDGWGARSRALVITATNSESATIELYRVRSDEMVRRVLETLKRVTGKELASPAVLNDTTAGFLRIGLLAFLAQAIRNGDSSVSAREWVDLMALTGIWSSVEPTDDEWTVFAAYLVAQKLESPGFATSVKTMSLMLNSPPRLQRLEVELNKVGSMNGLGTLMLSRHGVRAQGVLRRRSQAYIVHLREVIQVLKDAGYDAVIAYGTLLGAVREGRFLAHDDDIDILYNAKAHDRAAVEVEIKSIRDLFATAGFRVRDLLPKHLNMHVTNRKGGLVIDVFPCWLQDGKLQMHMEGMEIRGVAPGLMFPSSMVKLEGEDLPAPADPAGFLEERYGANWKVPDPYYDWPWKLQRE